MREFVTGKNDTGLRLDRFAAKAVPLLPMPLAQKYIRIKRIKVNDKGKKRDYRLVTGDVVQMYINDEFFETLNKESSYLYIKDPSLNIIYEDKNILLINKSTGVLCHSNGDYDNNSIISRVQAYLYRNGEWRPRDENSFTPALCNRIDRNTSGIIIAAKNAESLRIVNMKLKLQEIDRYYITIVHGKPKTPIGRLEGYIFKDAVKNRVYVSKNSQPGSKPAVMEYRMIATSNRLSLLECQLFTGRTHQIRAQLADIGCPVLGDGKYGSGQLDRAFDEKKQALCSYKLAFNFKTDAGVLSYLSGQTFYLPDVAFRDKYFGE